MMAIRPPVRPTPRYPAREFEGDVTLTFTALRHPDYYFEDGNLVILVSSFLVFAVLLLNPLFLGREYALQSIPLDAL